jgi:hypothetical protein
LAGTCTGDSSHKLKDLPACGEHPGYAIGIDDVLLDHLDLIHAHFLSWFDSPEASTSRQQPVTVCVASLPIRGERRSPTATRASMPTI